MSKKTKLQTRSDTEVKNEDWLLGQLTVDLSVKSGSLLPTNCEVLKHFLYLRRKKDNLSSKQDVALIVIKKVEEFWKASAIPITPNYIGKSRRLLDNLIKEYENLVRHKTRPTFSDSKTKFLSDLNFLFDISHANAVILIQQDRLRTKEQKRIDIEFLHDQRKENNKDKKWTIGSVDNLYAKKIERKLLRDTSAVTSQPGTSKLFEETDAGSSPHSSDRKSSESEPNVSSEEEYIGGSAQIKQKKSSLLKSKTFQLACDRIKLSSGQRTMLAAAVYKEQDVDIDTVALSKQTSLREGRKIRRECQNP